MLNRNLITSFFLIVALAVTAYGQDNTKTAPQKTLKEAYAKKFLIGTASDLRGLSEAELANVKTQYDILTPENCMKPQPIHPSENRYNFATADTLVDWCQKNGVKVWGHTLGWHSQTAPWFFQAVNPETEEALNRPEDREWAGIRMHHAPLWTKCGVAALRANWPAAKSHLERLKKHIKTVVGRYKGRIIGWDVFNESIADSGDCTDRKPADFQLVSRLSDRMF